MPSLANSPRPESGRVLSRAPDMRGMMILGVRTKGQLAIDLLGEVLADGIRLDFACGDEVYGSCTQLREYLEARGQAYVLRVPSNFYLTVARSEAHLQAGCRAGGHRARLGGSLGWPRRQGPALVRAS
jgi:hypothetical protein